MHATTKTILSSRQRLQLLTFFLALPWLIASCSSCTDDDNDSGGNAALCGDGIIDGEETCDDGNTVNDDGCSSACAFENSCSVALDYAAEATPGTGLTELVTGDLASRPSMLEESCGGAGREIVYAYTATSTGVLSVQLTAEDPLIVAAQSACGDTAAELFCEEAGTTAQLSVTEDDVIYIIVDAPAEVTGDAAFTLSTTLIPTLGAGQRCDASGRENTCTAGYRCEQNAPAPTCVTNTAPIVQSATVLRTGRKAKDLYISVTGTDAEGDIVSLEITGKNDASTVVSAATLYRFREDGFNAGAYIATFVANNFFAAYATASQFTLRVKDSGGLYSDEVEQARAEAPVLNAGAACDKNEWVNLCATGATTGYRCPSTETNPVCTVGQSPTLAADRVGYFIADAYGRQRIVVTGSDADSDLETAYLEFLDDAETPVTVTFSNGSAANAINVAINNAPNTPELDFQINASMLPTSVTKIAVTLKDHTQRESDRRVATRGAYPEKAASAACDPKRRFDHCADDFACTGDPNPTCSAGVAPVIDQAAYMHTPDGDFVLLEGHDTDLDLATVTLHFLNSAGDAMTVIDASGDGVADQDHITQSVADVEETTGDFFIPLDVSTLSDIAPKIDVTLTDFAGLTVSTGDPLAFSPQEIKAAGEACSLHGFDLCESGMRCASNERCTSLGTLRQAACTAADPNNIATDTWTSATVGPSLWDPPADCATNNPHGAPEGVARFTLNTEASSVVISTNHAGTTFDTILYVVAAPNACSSDTSAPTLLHCNDDFNEDLHLYTSELDISNLPAGTYLVIVDSYDAAGGTFELSVDITQ